MPEELKFIITADGTQAKAGFQQAGQGVDQLRQKTQAFNQTTDATYEKFGKLAGKLQSIGISSAGLPGAGLITGLAKTLGLSGGGALAAGGIAAAIGGVIQLTTTIQDTNAAIENLKRDSDRMLNDIGMAIRGNPLAAMEATRIEIQKAGDALRDIDNQNWLKSGWEGFKSLFMDTEQDQVVAQNLAKQDRLKKLRADAAEERLSQMEKENQIAQAILDKEQDRAELLKFDLRARKEIEAERKNLQGLKDFEKMPQWAAMLERLRTERAQIIQKQQESDNKKAASEADAMNKARDEVRMMEAKLRGTTLADEMETHRLTMIQEIAKANEAANAAHRDELALLARKKRDLADLLSMEEHRKAMEEKMAAAEKERMDARNKATDKARDRMRETPEEHNRRVDGEKMGRRDERIMEQRALNEERSRREKAKLPKMTEADERNFRGQWKSDRLGPAPAPFIEEDTGQGPHGQAAAGIKAAGQGAQALGAGAQEAAGVMNSAASNMDILAAAARMLSSRMAAVESAVSAIANGSTGGYE